MADTPNVGAPEWAAAQASPWLTANKARRIFDAFATVTIVQEMDLSSPPVTCADGARYLVNGTGSGSWLDHDGQLAIAVGTNAVNGWYFAVVALEGTRLHNRENGIEYRYSSGSWSPIDTSVNVLGDLADVDLTGLADGYTLKWDSSNQVWYPAPDIDTDTDEGALALSQLQDVDLTGLADGFVLKWDASNQLWYPAPDGNSSAGAGGGGVGLPLTFNFAGESTAYFYADEAMTLTQQATLGTGAVSYEKSTNAAPSTFSSTSSPVTLEQGAWLKVVADNPYSTADDPFVVHMKRTA